MLDIIPSPGHVVAGVEAMSQLDYIEGFYGFCDPHYLFCRRLVPVELPNGKTILAWVYEYNRNAENLKQIKSGDWVKRT